MSTSYQRRPQQHHKVELNKIGPEDPRYADLIRRGFNKRFIPKPDYVRLVESTDDVVEAVQEAVREKRRVVVRSGGHCLEGFVAEADVKVIVDTSLMTGVAFDAEVNAFVVQAGTTVGEMWRRLFLGWGVVVPAGESPAVGVGGHVLGGAFGFLCRQHGLAADHLYAVEVVVVDDTGTARSVVATREANDPLRELWWAHTGGGGGNFGIVTRYWFRSVGAGDAAGAAGATGTTGASTDPTTLLPRAPESIVTCRAEWKWTDVDEAAFTKLLRNFGTWCERNGGADSPNARLFTSLFAGRRQAGTIAVKGVSTAGADAERLFEEQLAAINDGVGVHYERRFEHSTWLAFALNPFPELFGGGSDNAQFKGTDAYLRARFTDRQIATIHHHLTRTDVDVPGGMIGINTYGGKVNMLASDATATAQRDSIMTSSCVAGWLDPADEARTLTWVREFYRDLFADTGGVPVPGERYDGAMINHPDVGLADPAWNTSGVPWYTFYYKDNYPWLQRVKARWDPRNVFHHALSIHV